MKLDKKLLGLLEAEQVTNLSRKLVEPAIDRLKGLVRSESSLGDTISRRLEYDWLPYLYKLESEKVQGS